MNFTVNQELIIRLTAFLSMLILMLVWEKLAPRRAQSDITNLRRVNNLVLVAINTLALRLLMPVAAVATAGIAQLHGWGIINYFEINIWIAVPLSFLLLDLTIYFQHRLMHRFSLLWRLHRVHHSDTEFDVTTGLRFHPFEILLSMCVKMLVVGLTGAPVLVVILFEIILNACSLFNHGNIALPGWIDHKLRLFLVTPDMHRVHHSKLDKETNSNFGFNLSCWDRVFATYREQPEMGHSELVVGLNEFRGRKFVHVMWLLRQPFLDSSNFTESAN